MTEWRDLLTFPDVAAAIVAKDEIQVGTSRLGVPCDWHPWDGRWWSADLEFRARPRQPKKRVEKAEAERDEAVSAVQRLSNGQTVREKMKELK